MDNLVLLLHVSASLAMFSLIWVIQILHYPSFHFVDQERFENFESFHAKRISYLVIPFMLTELFTGFYLVYSLSSNSLLWGLNLLTILLLWAITLFVSSPLHGQLLEGYNNKVVDQLISTNWYRTFLWTLKLPIIYLAISL